MHLSQYLTSSFLVFLCQSFQLSAQTTFISSGTGGDWSLASTWLNASVPGNDDNVIVTSGRVVTHPANEVINRIEIESGGQLISNARINIDGSHTINGEHSGTGRVQLRGSNDTIAGTDSITTSSIMRINNKRIIVAGSDFTRNGQNTRCPNNDTLFNFGTFATNRSIKGNGTSLVPLKLSAKFGKAQLHYQNDIFRDDFCVLLWNTTTNEQTLLDHSGLINIEFDSDNSELEYMVVVSRNSDGNISACEQLLSLDEKNQNKSIAYYSNNSITVETNGLNQKHQILDTKGRLVKTGRASDNVIPLEGLAPSVYFLQMDEGILKFIHQ